MPVGSWDDDDERSAEGDGKRLKDWDCPQCNANNPTDEVVDKKGLETRCNYCGIEFKITVSDEGKFKFKEM